VALINFKWNFSVRSESLNLQSTPHTSLPYNRIGETKESTSFSRRPQELSRPTVFFILKYVFLAMYCSLVFTEIYQFEEISVISVMSEYIYI
jgi:hypothetical protein